MEGGGIDRVPRDFLDFSFCGVRGTSAETRARRIDKIVGELRGA
jgi:hypothetical protein